MPLKLQRYSRFRWRKHLRLQLVLRLWGSCSGRLPQSDRGLTVNTVYSTTPTPLIAGIPRRHLTVEQQRCWCFHTKKLFPAAPHRLSFGRVSGSMWNPALSDKTFDLKAFSFKGRLFCVRCTLWVVHTLRSAYLGTSLIRSLRFNSLTFSQIFCSIFCGKFSSTKVLCNRLSFWTARSFCRMPFSEMLSLKHIASECFPPRAPSTKVSWKLFICMNFIENQLVYSSARIRPCSSKAASFA